MQTFHLPDVGEGLTEAEIVSWHVAPGDTVAVDDVVAAWRWNWRRRGEIRALHRRVEDFRGVPDAEIRRFQVRGFSRLNAFLRGTSSRGESPSDRAEGAWRTLVGGLRSGELRGPVVAWVITIVIVAFGSAAAKSAKRARSAAPLARRWAHAAGPCSRIAATVPCASDR